MHIIRDHSIDYFKGILVIGMIYAHVLQFFSDVTVFHSTEYICQYFNLITFSGFIFCFGYVCQLAYYSKPLKKVFVKMFLTGVKILVAFYISGLLFQVFIENKQLNMNTIKPIILLQVIPGWSEFLVSFSLIILIGLVLFPVFVKLSNNQNIFWGVCLLLMTTTLIDYNQINSTYMGLFIGTTHSPTFPVLQYILFYLIGIYFSKYRIRFQLKHLFISMIGTGLFLYYFLTHDFHLPERFPPSLFWIVGPIFFLYLYYIFSKTLVKFGESLRFLQIMGENVLFYLLISNILIFSLSNKLSFFIVGPWSGLLLTVSILIVITYFISIISTKRE